MINDPMSLDPREDKLPKWARRELKILRLRLKEANDKLDRHHATSGRTRVSYGDYGEDVHYIPELYPGRDQDITFRLGEKSTEDVRVGVRTDHDGSIKLDVKAGTSIFIEPRASNGFMLGFRK